MRQRRFLIYSRESMGLHTITSFEVRASDTNN
jgi:hypothetical protein